jgi:hypothetical protein
MTGYTKRKRRLMKLGFKPVEHRPDNSNDVILRHDATNTEIRLIGDGWTCQYAATRNGEPITWWGFINDPQAYPRICLGKGNTQHQKADNFDSTICDALQQASYFGYNNQLTNLRCYYNAFTGFLPHCE